MQHLELISEFEKSDGDGEAFLMQCRIPRHEALQCLAQHYGIPFIEYDKRIQIPAELLPKISLERLEQELWFPLQYRDGGVTVAVSRPRDPEVLASIRKTLGIEKLHLLMALPSDIIAIVENHQDINPDYPASASRTALAKLRTWFANQRVMLAQYRTILAKGRTGLAFIRTGIAFLSISLTLFRLFGFGYLTIPEFLLLVSGVVMVLDGFTWYLPARQVGRKSVNQNVTEPTFGTTILEQTVSPEGPAYHRTPPVPGADLLRSRWNRLSPVQKRRFLAIDRTDLAEERTILAGFRTIMAQSRTGLAFTRTGVAFIGLGIAFLREYHESLWSIFDIVMILFGISMTLEGLHWYLPGRQAGKYSATGLKKASRRVSIWDFMFPPFHKRISPDDLPSPLRVNGDSAPGIWGTTGLALERTLTADRRTVKARLRTVMAQSRTGLALIRTGTSIFSVGMGLQVFFGFRNLYWSSLNMTLITVGLALIVDGSYWHFPAEKIKKQFPYCTSDMEIALPDYGRPTPEWPKVVFSHDDM